MRTLLDLMLPQSCGGCGAAGIGWCAQCAASFAGAPARVRPRADPGLPCWALSSYSGPARRAVLALKEHGRRDLVAPLGLALAAGLTRLRDPDRPLVLVPAPSRTAAARRRGGDPVRWIARIAAGSLEDSQMVPMLQMWWGVRDSVGLTVHERRHNLEGRVTVATGRRPPAEIAENSEVVLVDDVLTTGATACVATRALARVGVRTRAAVVICAA